MPVVSDPIAGFDDDEIHPDREGRDQNAIGQPVSDQARDRSTKLGSLAVVHRFLGQAEVPARPPAHFDDHEGARRPRVDRDQVELSPPDVDLPGEDRPPGVCQAPRDAILGGVSRPLLSRAHEAG